MSIDAMQQALEALEYHQEQTRPIHKTQETITALRKAIREAALDGLAQTSQEIEWDTSDMAHRSGGLSVEQEKLCKYCGGIGRVVCDGKCMPEQEPFGYFQLDLRMDAWVQNRDNKKGVPFYTAPTKREWVSLTDDEVHEAAIKCVKSGQSVDAAIRAIEAKLKERNNG